MPCKDLVSQRPLGFHIVCGFVLREQVFDPLMIGF
jgi:hypothetical protein